MDYGDTRSSVSIEKTLKNAIMEDDDEETVFYRSAGQELNAGDKHPLLQVTYMKPDEEKDGYTSSSFSWYLLIAVLLLLVVASASFFFVTSLSHKEAIGNEEIPILVDRTMWDAVKPVVRAFLTAPANIVIVSHTEAISCTNNCSEEIHQLQAYQMSPPNNFSDIAYNFLIDQDGWVYEGRGWGVRPQVAEEFDGQALAIALIGNFNLSPPSNLQVKTFQVLIDRAVQQGNLTGYYDLVGLRQLTVTDSTGDELYILLRTWPHWKHCYMNTCIHETMQ